jgi:hypothetical protein
LSGGPHITDHRDTYVLDVRRDTRKNDHFPTMGEALGHTQQVERDPLGVHVIDALSDGPLSLAFDDIRCENRTVGQTSQERKTPPTPVLTKRVALLHTQAVQAFLEPDGYGR